MSKLIVDRVPMPSNYKDVDNEADELYLRCRRHFRFFRHKRAIRMADEIVSVVIEVMRWQSPSYKLNKMYVLEDYWEEVRKSLERIHGIKKDK